MIYKYIILRGLFQSGPRSPGSANDLNFILFWPEVTWMIQLFQINFFKKYYKFLYLDNSVRNVMEIDSLSGKKNIITTYT